ncbi:MAG: calcium/sodium antiporter [Candidatus Neomarinimicrobiota bacterium]|nr:calcium/sodium antiporter [Candidatus Neomarinimicrobiota bacterium]
MTESIFVLFLGSLMLYFGSEWIVKGGVAIAEKYGISTLVIGLTIVAFGTSLPELLVSLNAAFQGSSSIAVGNAIGSNVANVGLVLSLSALIFPISLNYSLIKRDLYIYILSCIIFILFSLDGRLSKFEGAFFVNSLLFYIIYSIKKPIKTDSDIETSDNDNFSEMVLFVIFGIVALSLGADLFVDGSVFIARYFGISEVVIGMSIVAFGTSLPELATSAMAAYKKQSAISIGNIIGSNIFNILCVLGITSIIQPLNSNWNSISVQTFIMIFYGLSIFLAAKLTQPINRIFSGFMLAGYFLFIYLLF